MIDQPTASDLGPEHNRSRGFGHSVHSVVECCSSRLLSIWYSHIDVLLNLVDAENSNIDLLNMAEE